MRRFLPRGWPRIWVLVALLACGCRHSRCCCSNCHAPTAATRGTVLAGPCRPAPAADAPTQANKPGRPAVPAVVHRVAKPALPPADAPTRSQASLPHPAAAAQPVAHQELSASSLDAPAPPRFAHDANYRWLVGELDYSRIQKAWLLRYVPFEEEDRYGGCVTLIALPYMRNFKPGQTVRVEGFLIDPDSQQLRPAFQVRRLRVE